MCSGTHHLRMSVISSSSMTSSAAHLLSWWEERLMAFLHRHHPTSVTISSLMMITSIRSCGRRILRVSRWTARIVWLSWVSLLILNSHRILYSYWGPYHRLPVLSRILTILTLVDSLAWILTLRILSILSLCPSVSTCAGPLSVLYLWHLSLILLHLLLTTWPKFISTTRLLSVPSICQLLYQWEHALMFIIIRGCRVWLCSATSSLRQLIEKGCDRSLNAPCCCTSRQLSLTCRWLLWVP